MLIDAIALRILSNKPSSMVDTIPYPLGISIIGAYNKQPILTALASILNSGSSVDEWLYEIIPSALNKYLYKRNTREIPKLVNTYNYVY